MISLIRFYWFQTCFGLKEEWANFWSGLFSYLLFPIYVLVLSSLWIKYRSIEHGMNASQMIIYVGIAEAILMTTLNSLPFNSAMGDFSYTLSRPKSWFIYYSSLILGRNIGRRIIYVAILIITLSPFVEHVNTLTLAGWRLIQLIPILAFVEIGLCFFWILLQILFVNVSYFRFAVIKLLMVTGGVFTPLDELTPTLRNILLATPQSDFIFQPAYFSIHGSFYELTMQQWFIHILVEIVVLILVGVALFKYARHRQQVYGG